jgi:hypothetical protein
MVTGMHYHHGNREPSTITLSSWGVLDVETLRSLLGTMVTVHADPPDRTKDYEPA